MDITYETEQLSVACCRPTSHFSGELIADPQTIRTVDPGKEKDLEYNTGTLVGKLTFDCELIRRNLMICKSGSACIL